MQTVNTLTYSSRSYKQIQIKFDRIEPRKNTTNICSKPNRIEFDRFERAHQHINHHQCEVQSIIAYLIVSHRYPRYMSRNSRSQHSLKFALILLTRLPAANQCWSLSNVCYSVFVFFFSCASWFTLIAIQQMNSYLISSSSLILLSTAWSSEQQELNRSNAKLASWEEQC